MVKHFRVPLVSGINWDYFFEKIARFSGIFLISALAIFVYTLLLESAPAIKHFGWGILFGSTWDPGLQVFQGFGIIIGTLETSFLSLMIAIPLSLGVAILIVYILPKKISRILARLAELMAGIPSIIYGMWGMFVLAPFLSKYIQTPLVHLTHHIPILNSLLGTSTIGFGYFAAGIILAIMVIPLISSIVRDILLAVPEVMIESASAMGATRYEVLRYVVFPYVRAGVFGAIVLGFGRAIGETMAVTFVIGNAHTNGHALFSTGSTIATTISNEFPEAFGQIYASSLVTLGLILFLLNFVILLLSRGLLSRSRIRGGTQ